MDHILKIFVSKGDKMTRTKLIAFLALGALAIAAVFGVTAYQSAQAQAPTTTSTAPVNSHGGPGLKAGYSSNDLAAALGISVDELTAAYQKANEAALAQAVEKGLITQAQADEMKTKDTARPFGGRRGGMLSQNGIDFDALLADALGISVEKLQAAYAQAYNANIDQAVTDGKLTADQADLLKGQYALSMDETFRSTMQSAYKSAVQQAVKDGVITQSQADQILQNIPSFGGARVHGFGGMDSGHGHGPKNDSAVPSDTDSSTLSP
jgi:hypothetical protein